MPIKAVEDSLLTQPEKDDVVLAIVEEGGIFSKTPPTDLEGMKKFIENNREEIMDLFDTYAGFDKENRNSSRSKNIQNIPNIGKFFDELIVPAVESLSKEGKLPQKEPKEKAVPLKMPKVQPTTAAFDSYQANSPVLTPPASPANQKDNKVQSK